MSESVCPEVASPNFFEKDWCRGLPRTEIQVTGPNYVSCLAAIVVVLSSLAAGVGALSLGASNFLYAPILSLFSWYIWAYLIYFIGAKLFPESLFDKDTNTWTVVTKTNHGELLRTIGFSSAPGIIRVFGFTPELMSLTFII